MAKMTLLQMVTTACSEMGLPAPITLASTVDSNAVQLLAIANREAKECARAANAASGWQALRQEYTFNVQSTGIITGCSYTKGSNVITIGTPPTQAPQLGWTIATSGGSNSTGFSYPTIVTAVNGSSITVSTAATKTISNTSMAFGQETYALPADFDYMINQTMWDRGYRWQVFGGLTPQEWQVLKSGLSPTGPRRRFRIMDGALHLDPIPYDSNILVYEYYSTNFCLTGGFSTASASLFTTDTDTYILNDDLLIMGIMWRWRRAKGLDYQQEYKTYSDAMQRELGRDATARPLRLDVITPDVALMTANQVPDTGFGTGQ
jgi:hypothetical protein